MRLQLAQGQVPYQVIPLKFQLTTVQLGAQQLAQLMFQMFARLQE